MPEQYRELARQIHSAVNSKAVLQITGNASKPWLTGRGELDLSECRGVVSYQPSERVITVRSGTPLAELEEHLREQGQMLAAECPDFDGGGTIGGAVAVGWNGPRAIASGSLRDAMLGVRMINGDGDVLSFGGQVMKNVVGFDVPRLLVGSLGRLGVILEVSLKLHPMPQAEYSLQRPVESLADACAVMRELLLRGEPLSGAVHVDGQVYLRFSGSKHSVDRIAREQTGTEVSPDFWQQLRQLKLPTLLEPVALPVTDCFSQVSWVNREGELWREQLDHVLAVSQGPRELPGDAAGAVQQRLRQAFDPASVFGGERAD